MCAAIQGKCFATGVDDDAARIGPTDDPRHHRQRAVFGLRRTQRDLHAVVEHVVAGPEFGYARDRPGVARGRR